MNNVLIGALALAVAAAAGSASADTNAPGIYSVRVHVGNLNLQDRHDAKILLARINEAAMEACGANIWSSPQEWAAVRQSQCRADAVAHTVAAVGAPTLSAVFRESPTLAFE